MEWLRSLLLPVAGSAYARQVDDLFIFITFLSAFLFLLVTGLLAVFLVRYRRRRPGEVTPHIVENFKLEVVWTVIPLALVTVVFFWGFVSFMQATVAPADALEIQVTAKRWLWEFEYPNGTRTINEIHVPIGKPVKLVMSSQDVIHSFFVPSFRLKTDVLPNRYTELWFTPTSEGLHTLFCAEYCGRGHSDMSGRIWVDSEAKYQEWLEKGDPTSQSMPLAQLGALLYTNRGCATCHSLDGSRGQGPSFKGIFGQQHRMTDGKSFLVDENYLRNSILQPQTEIREGYEGIMPTFQGVLRDREILALIEFIKSQQ
jgi:cytochrome c oxidase subunit 2